MKKVSKIKIKLTIYIEMNLDMLNDTFIKCNAMILVGILFVNMTVIWGGIVSLLYI